MAIKSGDDPRALRLDRLREEADRTCEVSPVHAHLLAELLAQGLVLEALERFERLRCLPASSPDAQEALAFYARRLGLHETSNIYYRRAVMLAPDSPRLWHNLATSERSLGRLQEAVEACNRALQLSADPFPTLLLRSECARATPSNNHVDELRRLLAEARSSRHRMFVGYALGKELHDLREFNSAFPAFARAARARRDNLAYEVNEDTYKLRRIAEAFSKPVSCTPLEGRAEHVFIIGLPRSGTTLAERILSGLEGVRSNGETDNFFHALIRAAPASGQDVFDRCAQADNDQCAAYYEEVANPRRDDVCVVEKLPLNYLYAGAIARSLPSARIIWINRNPVDSCFAMWRTLFAEAYPFSYDFEDLAAYFTAYRSLKAHWDRTLGEIMLEVSYEELVQAPAVVGRKMAEHCGLAWNDGATEISRLGSASLTASATQVREEIYPHASGVWQHYGGHLDPLVAALERYS